MQKFERWGIVSGVLLFIVLVVSIFFLLMLRPVHTESLEAEVKVDDYVGFNLDRDKLYFGTVSPGSKALRSMSLHTDKKYFVKVVLDKDVGSWVVPSHYSFMISPPAQNVQFTVFVPQNTTLGNYSTSIDFVFYKPIVGLLA